jgi:hypothetical protein
MADAIPLARPAAVAGMDEETRQRVFDPQSSVPPSALVPRCSRGDGLAYEARAAISTPG